MKKISLLLLLLTGYLSQAQQFTEPDAKGDQLRSFYLSLNVENLWIAGMHVNWQTGVADNPDATSGNHTHCSAFAAAACKRLGIYILRPPDHKQILLANAQYEWLTTPEAGQDGWRQVDGNDTYMQAQTMANKGMVVIAVVRNPDEHKPGHIGMIMPAKMTRRKLEEGGPAIIQAGTHNHNEISMKAGFHSHLPYWPERNVLFYYNTVPPSYPTDADPGK